VAIPVSVQWDLPLVVTLWDQCLWPLQTGGCFKHVVLLSLVQLGPAVATGALWASGSDHVGSVMLQVAAVALTDEMQ